MSGTRARLTRYGIAVAAVALATLLRWAFDPWLGDAFQLTPLYGAVALSVWFGGAIPAWVASGIGYLISDYLFILPRGTLGPVTPRDWIAIALYASSCAIIIGFGLAARNAQRLSRRQLDELRRRDDDTRRLLDMMPVAVWIAHDPGCEEITGNQMANALVGVPPGTNMAPSRRAEGGVPEIRHVDPEGREVPPADLPLQRAVATGRPVTGVALTMIRPGREPVPILGNAAPRLDETGTVRGAVAAFTDISELRRSEEALRDNEEWLRLALDAGRFGTFLYDFTTHSVNATARYKELLGFHAGATPSVEELSARIDPDDLARTLAEWQLCVAERRRTDVEYRVRLPDGSTRWVSSVGRATYDEHGRPQRFIGILMDISARKRAEQRLRDEDRRKDEFLAIMAHELRNPLAPIRNAVAVLGALGSPEPELAWAGGVIARQVEHMARLLDDLLDVSRITRNRLELRPQRVRLTQIVQRSLETSRPLFEAAGQRLTVVLPPADLWLEVDLLRTSQALSNLLNNAARYTARGGRVRMSARRDGDEAVISVEDDGIGIPAEHLPHVFEIFYQAASAGDRSEGGLGIGLSLVRGIVEAQGGRVEARSAGSGQGSTFVIHLPALAPVDEDARRAAPADLRSHAPALRILVADDHPDGLESLAMMLRIAGHEVHTARDGLEAVDLAARVEPQVVLMDLGMPRLDGCEAARRIGEQSRVRDAVMVAITGWGRSEDRQRAAAAGFHHHLVKPVEPEALHALLRQIVGGGAGRPAHPVGGGNGEGGRAPTAAAQPAAAATFDFPPAAR